MSTASIYRTKYILLQPRLMDEDITNHDRDSVQRQSTRQKITNNGTKE